MELGVLKRHNPREVWSHEAHKFTPWLAEHLSALGQAVGLDLELVDMERGVGDFSADIVARDLGRNRVVVIENQLELTDHGHLGQIITYAAGVEAGTVIWISSDMRDEHRQALDWLNRGFDGDTDFFGVALEVLCIDDSRRAVNFRLVAAPHRWSARKAGSSSSGELTDLQVSYQKFFQRLIDILREQHRMTNARAAQPQNWYSFATGHKGLSYSASYAQGGRVRTEIYIDAGDADENLALFQHFRGHQGALEAQFPEGLEWEELETRRACRIACYRMGSIADAQELVDEYLQWVVDRLLLFRKAFAPLMTSARADQ